MSVTPHLSPKAAGIAPVETHEVVEAVAALLRAHGPFVAHLRPAGSLHVHRLPLNGADGGAESEGAPLWALLRETKPVGASTPRNGVAGLAMVRMQLQLNLDARHRSAAASPDRVLSYGHVLAYDALQEQPLSVAEGSGAALSAYSVRQTGRPSPAMEDGRGRLYSSAYYSVTVYPTAAP